MFYRFLFYFVRLRRRTNKLAPTTVLNSFLNNPHPLPQILFCCRDRFTGPCVSGERRKSIFDLTLNWCWIYIYVFSFFISIRSPYGAGPINWSLHGLNIQLMLNLYLCFIIAYLISSTPHTKHRNGKGKNQQKAKIYQ